MEDMLYKWIPTVGFPMAVAAYILIRIEPKIINMTEAINKSREIINQLIPLIQQDTENTKGVKDVLESLRLEIAKMNGKK